MKKAKLIIFSALVVIIFGCEKQQCEVVEPTIEFLSFEKNGDSTATLTITFEDCDRDVGLAESDTSGPYSIDGDYYYNLWLDYHELQNGEWVLRDDFFPLFRYRIPKLSGEEVNRPMTGDIILDLEPFYFLFGSPYDTFKFEITLVDRALNESNKVETPLIVKG
ncbi:MAG: hypothetical protein MRY83_21845 [Flavobacteriales bacterium]|nr:hypothetical protein [Flavobacteriales bacterium]